MISIQKNKSLRDYNSFHFDVEAKYFVSIESIDDIQKLIQEDIFCDNKRLIVGGGSNMLLTQEYFDGLVIHNAIIGKDIMYEDESHVILRVWAGEVWHDLVMRTVDQWRWWLENLALIPGSVGAAPMQNIGAYGIEVKDVIEFVEYIDLSDGSTHVLDNGSCAFEYRDSVFKRELKDRAFITSVIIRLHKTNYLLKLDYKDIQQEITIKGSDREQISVKDVAHMITEIRRRKLPDWTQIGTAGSFFKNPIVSAEKFQSLKFQEISLVWYEVSTWIKLSAGQLIELAGLKWIEKWSVWTYKNHALVLVHHGWGKGSDIVALAKHIQNVVHVKFGVLLEPEVNYIE